VTVVELSTMNFQADPFATLLPADIVGAGRTIGDTPTV